MEPIVSGPVREVMDVASSYFDATDRAEVEALTLFYEDRAREIVKTHLRGLGLGVLGDPHPVESGLLRYVVQSLAVSYRSPPTRFAARGGQRLGDDHPAQAALWSVYASAGVDATLRHVDQLRTLWRTCFLRVYTSELARRVKLVPFAPHHVFREPTAGEEGDPRADRRIAIRRADSSFELWVRGGEGWSLTLHDPHGAQISAAEEYEVLPVVAHFDGLPTQPYLRPPQSRVSYLLKIAACLNETVAAVKWDVHPRATFETDVVDRAGNVGRKINPAIGPGTAMELPPGVKLRLHQVQPQIEAIGKAAMEFVESWFRTESLPTDSFRQSQAVTALGLQTLAQPLRERRESLLPFVAETEARLFDVVRSLHNPWAETWGAPRLAEDVDLELVLGDIDVPADPVAMSDGIARDVALRLASRIDGLMRRYGEGRHEAIARAQRIDEDLKAYGVGRIPEIERGLALAENTNPAASTVGTAQATMEPTP